MAAVELRYDIQTTCYIEIKAGKAGNLLIQHKWFVCVKIRSWKDDSLKRK